MQTGAVITAAGMSSRMGDFKPMLNIGSISIAQRVVATLRQAGVSKIVMVTGYQALLLERHLAGNGIVFLRNEQYATTQMFDSVRIGLNYIKDKCDRVLFTPVDIPLFTADTVRAMMACEADLACPVCNGETGHPILISCSLIDSLLNDSGENGLHGALSRLSVPMTQIPVEDAGVLHDADTPEDYQELLKFHNQQLIRPVVHLSFARETEFFDENIATLLTLVEETHSVRSACQRMQISYSSGWNALRRLEGQLGMPLVHRTQGGAHGSRSELTENARKLLRYYEQLSDTLRRQAEDLFEVMADQFQADDTDSSH
ncbi:MAG: NTP transferase domain-containing protein [Lachnospiraceae bacterium]|nr:NTP transferase domain-containing protein [Lachnospiraceae bacterium]